MSFINEIAKIADSAIKAGYLRLAAISLIATALDITSHNIESVFPVTYLVLRIIYYALNVVCVILFILYTKKLIEYHDNTSN